MQGILLLCDFAEEINGKLYIMGGGWSRLKPPGPQIAMSLAVKLFFPWPDAVHAHTVTVRLVDAHERAAVLQGGQPIAVTGHLEVGKPSGLAEEAELDVPLAFRLEGLQLDPGRYRWELLVDDDFVQSATFEVLP